MEMEKKNTNLGLTTEMEKRNKNLMGSNLTEYLLFSVHIILFYKLLSGIYLRTNIPVTKGNNQA
jgi:hypothetical protein